MEKLKKKDLDKMSLLELTKLSMRVSQKEIEMRDKIIDDLLITIKCYAGLKGCIIGGPRLALDKLREYNLLKQV